MRDSRSIEAECGLQPRFRKSALAQGVGLFALVLTAASAWIGRPNRVELGWRHAKLQFAPIRIDPAGVAPLHLVGAWRLTSADPRFGGLSALAIDHGQLLALSDSGVLVRFDRPRPGVTIESALIGELPDGPGDPRWKDSRDSEGLARDPAGRGYWVSFEQRHELWLYDPEFRRALLRMEMGAHRWPINSGVEALAPAEAGLVAIQETHGTVLRINGTHARGSRLAGMWGSVSEASRLPDGRLLLIERKLTLLGFANRLALVGETAAGLRVSREIPLGIGPFVNLEAMASEPLPDGAIRLWLMTDDNFQTPMRTLLLALDLPPNGRIAR